MITIRRRLSAGLLVVAAAFGLSTPAHAVSYTYSFQDVDFTFDGTNGSNTFTLRIENALDASGDWAPAVSLQALGFKDLGIDFQAIGVSAALTSDPTSTWAYIQAETDANACKVPSGQKGVICFQTAPALALTNDMLFTVTITGAVLNIGSIGPHVKLQFLDANGDKQGSLLSENFTTSSSGGGSSGGNGSNGNQVPEPSSSLVLLGLGALGMGFVRRRRKAAA